MEENFLHCFNKTRTFHPTENGKKDVLSLKHYCDKNFCVKNYDQDYCFTIMNIMIQEKFDYQYSLLISIKLRLRVIVILVTMTLNHSYIETPIKHWSYHYELVRWASSLSSSAEHCLRWLHLCNPYVVTLDQHVDLSVECFKVRSVTSCACWPTLTV